MTDLLKTFIKKTSQSHTISLHRNTMPIEIQIKDNHTEIVINNRGHHCHHRNNTRINEIGEFHSDYTSSCSDQSDVEEEFDTQEPPTSEN